MSNQGYLRTKAMPITVEFRDFANYVATARFYVREGASVEDCKSLIEKVIALQLGHVNSYTIGYHKTVFAQKPTVNEHAIGGAKWLIGFTSRSDDGSQRHKHQTTVPCADIRLGYPPPHAKLANLELPEWKEFLDVFLRLCVGEEGNSIDRNNLRIEWKMYNWPPKGQRRRR